MKKVLVTALLALFLINTYAQDAEVEKEIRSLENKSITALMQKDTATLGKMWARDFMVNAPINKVVVGKQLEMIMKGTIAYTSFTHELEHIMIKGDVVITMGSETVVPVIGNPGGGQTIHRRYTQIWQKQSGDWKLIARQASIVCSL